MRLSATLILVLGMLMPTRAHAQEAQQSEYQVKAKILFTFAKFIEWPQAAFTNAKAPLIIGLLGDNPFGSHLESFVRDKVIGNRPVIVKSCQTIEEAKKCHLLFISVADKKRLQENLDGLTGASVLTVGESEAFTKSGGMIRFFLEGQKVRFEINDDAAKKAGLKIDSKLLGLGKKANA